VPRAIWNGSISFGLVTIPVKLYNAVSRKSVHFNQLDDRTGARIKYQKVSAADGEEVPNEHIVRGYEYAKGQYVTIDDEELAAVTPAAQRTIDIEAFVELDEINPILYDGAYYAAPVEGFDKPYKLLVEALGAEKRVAVARFVRANKQYLAALWPQDGRLMLSTMVWADELVEPAAIEELEGIDDVKLSDAELAMATQLVDSLASRFDPDEYHDTYRNELVALLERKAAGEEVVTVGPVAADEGRVVDLMAALEASVAAAKAARGAGGDGEEAPDAAGETEAEEVAVADGAGGRSGQGRGTRPKAAAKKRAPKKAPARRTAAKAAPKRRSA